MRTVDPFSPFPSAGICASLQSNVFLKKSQLGIPLNSLILMDLQSHSPPQYPALSGYKQICSVHLWAIFPTWPRCTIISSFSRSWYKTKMAERFVGCKEGTKCKAQMDAIPREERNAWWVICAPCWSFFTEVYGVWMDLPEGALGKDLRI